MTLDESIATLREVFGDQFTPRVTMTHWEFFDSVVTLAALQAKRLQELETRVAELEGKK